jgi:hypothetical protein
MMRVVWLLMLTYKKLNATLLKQHIHNNEWENIYYKVPGGGDARSDLRD